MTWVSWETAKQGNPNSPMGQGFLNNFMTFLQSPEAQGLSHGLLAGSQNGQSFSGALGQGLMLGHQYRSKKEEEELKKAAQELEKLYKMGMLDIHKGELAQRRAEHAANMGLKREEMEYEREYKRAQIDKMLADEEQRRKRAEWLQNYTSGAVGTQANGEGVSEDEASRRQRAALLAAAGYDQEAFKVLTEKPEKDKTAEPTPTFLTQNQNVIQAASNIVPVIDELLETGAPGQIVGKYTSPDKQAAYEAATITIAEGLLAARNLPQTEGSLNKMLKVAQRQPLESESAYKKRLEGLKQEVLERAEKSGKITSVGTKGKSENKSKYAGSKKVKRIYKGETYLVPEELLAEFDREHK